MSGINFNITTSKPVVGSASGLVVESVNLGSTLVISSAYPTYVDVLSLSIDTSVGNQTVLINFSGCVAGGAGNAIYFSYKLDSDADEGVTIQSVATGQAELIEFGYLITVPTAGTHTIKVRACRDGATNISILDDTISKTQFYAIAL